MGGAVDGEDDGGDGDADSVAKRLPEEVGE